MRTYIEPVAIQQLEGRCAAASEAFMCEGAVLQQEGGLLIHRDAGSSVLGIAHLDFVGGTKHTFSYSNSKKGERTVMNERLDDRLGAYLLLDYLPSIGVNCDVLLTDNEEKGKSTAASFVTLKNYNWIFSFDRRGDDVVLYQYATESLVKMMENNTFKVGSGSYSCIANLEHLGVSGINFGTGYHRNHSPQCYAELSETEKMANAMAK